MVVCSTTTSGPFFNNHISESSSVPLLFHKSLAFSSVSCWLLLHSITPFLRHSLVMYRTVVNTRQLQYLCYASDESKVLFIKLEAAFYVWSIGIDFKVFGRNLRIYLCAKSSPISNFHLWSSSKWIWFWHTPTLPYPIPLKSEREEGPCCFQSRAQKVFWNRLHSSRSQCRSSSQKANRQAREEIAQTHHVKNIEAEVEIYCDGAATIWGLYHRCYLFAENIIKDKTHHTLLKNIFVFRTKIDFFCQPQIHEPCAAPFSAHIVDGGSLNFWGQFQIGFALS